MGIKLSDFDFELTKRQKREFRYHYTGNYVIGTIGDDGFLTFFCEKMDDGYLFLSRIAPRRYKNRKKAKRVLKRLNKTYSGEFFVVRYDELKSKSTL